MTGFSETPVVQGTRFDTCPPVAWGACCQRGARCAMAATCCVYAPILREAIDRELCAEIAARYMAGARTEDLAAQYGFNVQAILFRVRRGGGQVRPKGRRRLVAA